MSAPSVTDIVYARAGFGATVPRGPRPAVIVVDLIHGFTDPAAPTGADLTGVVTATADLIAAARPAEIPVVFTTVSYTPAETTALAWLKKAPGLAALREGSREVTLDDRLPVLATDHLITKKGASGFFGSSLAAILTGLRVDTVLICGATTSGCVRATVVDAVQSGFGVLVPRNCVGDRATDPHEANLFDIHAKYGDVIDMPEALSYLGGLDRPRPLAAAR